MGNFFKADRNISEECVLVIEPMTEVIIMAKLSVGICTMRKKFQ
jgi:hypothetical protein